MSWGISDNANKKEKLKAEINDYFHGLNSTCEIDYKAYSQLYDVVMPIIDDMYKRWELDAWFDLYRLSDMSEKDVLDEVGEMSNKLKPNPCCGRCKYFVAVTGQGLYDDYDGYCHIDGTDINTTSYCEQFEPRMEKEG